MTFARRSAPPAWRRIVTALGLATLVGCVGVTYQRPGHPITALEDKALVFGRLRFFHDGLEFFPWEPTLFAPPVRTDPERHVWLLRLGRRAVSSEIHPDPDGSLAIWLDSGDYALVASTRLPTTGLPQYEVAALIRIPRGASVVYAGDLIMRTETHEGWYASHGELGEMSVAAAPIDSARAAFEGKFGPLPEAPVRSTWCAGDQVPDFDDPGLASRGRALLDQGCEPGEPRSGTEIPRSRVM